MNHENMYDLFSYILKQKLNAQMYNKNVNVEIQLTDDIKIELSNIEKKFVLSIITCDSSVLDCSFYLNTAYIANIMNRYCNRIIRGLGECLMTWLLSLFVYLDTQTVRLIDAANVSLPFDTDSKFKDFVKFRNTKREKIVVPYRLFKFDKLLESYGLGYMKTNYKYWGQCSYYNKFGFVDTNTNEINYTKINTYYLNLSRDMFDSNMILDLTNMDNRYINSRFYYRHIGDYLKHRPVNLIVNECFQIENENETTSVSETDVESWPS